MLIPLILQSQNLSAGISIVLLKCGFFSDIIIHVLYIGMYVPNKHVHVIHYHGICIYNEVKIEV